MRANESMLNSFGIEGCGCYACVRAVVATRPFPENLSMPFIVCELCGNKRCPKATYHANECSRSNESGQTGSLYGELTEQEKLLIFGEESEEDKEAAIWLRETAARLKAERTISSKGRSS